VASAVRENPVMAVELIGLTAMSPVITDLGTEEIPDFARIAYLPAVPRLTGADLVIGAVAITALNERANTLKIDKIANIFLNDLLFMIFLL